MTNAIILDILVVLIVLLSVPLGFWRGVSREIFVSVAVLFAWTISETKPVNWSAKLAERLTIDPAVAQFLIVIGITVLMVLVIGYGGGALIVRDSFVGLWNRLVGGALAATNMLILLALVLRSIDQDLGQTYALGVLRDGWIARFLIVHLDWLLAAMGAGWVLFVSGAGIAWFFTGPHQPLPTVDETGPPDRSETLRERRRPVRLPKDPEGGKFEPTEENEPEEPSLMTSVPLHHVDTNRWSTDRANPQWVPTPWRTTSSPEAESGREEQELSGKAWVKRTSSKPELPDDGRRTGRCERCGQKIGRDDIYCPRCGHSMTG